MLSALDTLRPYWISLGRFLEMLLQMILPSLLLSRHLSASVWHRYLCALCMSYTELDTSCVSKTLQHMLRQLPWIFNLSKCTVSEKIWKIRQSMQVTCATASCRNLQDPHCSYCAWSGICAGLMDNLVKAVHTGFPKWKIICMLYLYNISRFYHILYYIKKNRISSVYVCFTYVHVIYLTYLNVQSHRPDTRTSQQNSLT